MRCRRRAAAARHVPVPLALAAGTSAQTAWGWAERLRPGRTGDPPMTRFVVEQLSTRTGSTSAGPASCCGWTPRISLDEGLELLARWYSEAAR